MRDERTIKLLCTYRIVEKLMKKIDYSGTCIEYDNPEDNEEDNNDKNIDEREGTNECKDEEEYAEELDPRVEFDAKTTPHMISSQIQSSVDEIISNCPEVDWNENLLTYKLIENLRYILSNYKMPGIIDYYSENKFNFEAYKLTGNAEQSHGDIAIVVNRKFGRSNKPISGVAFYEAKASALGLYRSSHYPSFCIQQLRRLVTNTPKLNYLLYSKESKKVNSRDWPTIEEPTSQYNEWNSDGSYANAITIDANFLKESRNLEMATRTVGLPFGEHFVNRVLSGRELDYSRSVDKTLKRWLKYTRRSAPYVISVSVQEEFSEPFTSQLELPGFERVEFPELNVEHNRINNKNK